MTEWIKNLFVAIFGENSWLATIIISMIPIVELRGAIPFGSATALWGENALKIWESFLYSVLGSTLVCVILTFVFWPVFKWLKNTKAFKKLATAIENKLNRSSKNINDKTKSEENEKKVKRIKWLGIFAFVAIPLPLTGVWTGTCIALFVGMSKKDTILSVSLGNLVAGIIMTIISYFFADNTMIVLLAFLAIVAVFVLFFACRAIIKKIKNKKNVKNHSSEILEISNMEENDMQVEEINSGSETNLENVEEVEKPIENNEENEEISVIENEDIKNETEDMIESGELLRKQSVDKVED